MKKVITMPTRWIDSLGSLSARAKSKGKHVLADILKVIEVHEVCNAKEDELLDRIETTIQEMRQQAKEVS